MEDNVQVYTLDDFLIQEFVKDEITFFDDELWKHLHSKAGVIVVELWGKEWIGMTPGLYSFVRDVINEFAKKYNLAKVGFWGMDDGGTVYFDKFGDAMFRTYYSRRSIEINTFGPHTEDQFWIQFEPK